jgi:phosphoserine aminotransferase
MTRPLQRPIRPLFSSGPCAKRPGWTPTLLNTDDPKVSTLGRSHRSKPGKDRLAEVIAQSRRLLGIPADYRLGIVPASDTGAVEMALWSLLGPQPITVLAFESFSEEWANDIINELHLPTKLRRADYGILPDLRAIDPADDVVFTWNGTTPACESRTATGSPTTVGPHHLRRDLRRVRHGPALAQARCRHLVLAEGLGRRRRARHDRALSPARLQRLQSHTPAWPMPKIFRLAKGGKLIEGIFKGETINTPSMLCVEDRSTPCGGPSSVGGLKGLIARSEGNAALIADWVESTSDWAGFLAKDPATRSCTSMCLAIKDPWFTALEPADQQQAIAKDIVSLLDKEGVGLRHRRLSRRAAGPAHLVRRHRREATTSRRCCPGSTGPMQRGRA